MKKPYLVLSPLDKAISVFDGFLQQLAPAPQATSTSPNTRSNPAKKFTDPYPELGPQEKQQAIEMMRINHSGEICAQALYQGQALMAKETHHQSHLKQAAEEEQDHLTWCKERVEELGGRTSYLNPIWYGGSLAIGILAGLRGDPINLGFLAETERQVTKHLEGQLSELSPHDQKTRAIITQMRDDELKHAEQAVDAGGISLPLYIRTLMAFASKCMIHITRII